MKTIYIFLLLMTTFLFICQAQEVPAVCKEGAENRNCSAISRTTSSTVSVWDWRNPENYSYHISNIDPIDVEGMNPFTPYNNGACAIDNVHFLYYGSPNITDIDYEPTDGWELILKEFGTSQNNVDFPYFILYNRYESKMRVFILIPRNSQDFDAYNAATVRTKFSETQIVSPYKYQSGLLEHVSSPANSLQDMSKSVVASTPNSFYLASFVWLIADIPVAYDPCTCYYPSMLEIEPRGYKSEEVKLNLHANGTISLMQDVSDASGVDPSDGGINTLKDVKDGVEKGTKAFKSLGEFALAMDELVQALAPVVAGAAVVVAPELAVLKLPVWFLAAVSGGEAAVSVMDLFIGGGKEEAETKPFFFHGQEKFDGTVTGTIEEHQVLSAKTFYTPGSNVKPNYPDTHPIYDNTLGVMHLLKTPELLTTIEPIFCNTCPPTSFYFKSTAKLRDDIVYAINPSSGLSQEAVNIYAAIIIEYPNISYQNPYLGNHLYGLTKISDSVYRTPYLPLPCLKEFMIGVYPGVFEFPVQLAGSGQGGIKSAKLHLVATLKRDPSDYNYSPSATEVLFAATYKIDVIRQDLQNPTFPVFGFADLQNSLISNVQENPVVENLSLSADKTIYGYGTITVKDNIQTNGFHLTLIAGKEILVESANTDLWADMDLEIGKVPGCEGKIPAWDASNICLFCNQSETYNPNIVEKVGNNVPNPSLSHGIVENAFMLNAYPLPFSTDITLQYVLWQAESVSLNLSDLTGRRVENILVNEAQEAGSRSLNIDGTGLSAGVYFLTITTSHNTETIKLVKE